MYVISAPEWFTSRFMALYKCTYYYYHKRVHFHLPSMAGVQGGHGLSGNGVSLFPSTSVVPLNRAGIGGNVYKREKHEGVNEKVALKIRVEKKTQENIQLSHLKL